MLPILAVVFRLRKRPVGASWGMDEIYINVGGEWKYLYRAVDKAGQTIDFLLRAHRDYAAARRFFERAIYLHGVPEKITIDKSGANTTAIEGLRADSVADIELRQSSICKTSSSKTTGPSSVSCDPCSGSRAFAARALIAAASRPCT